MKVEGLGKVLFKHDGVRSEFKEVLEGMFLLASELTMAEEYNYPIYELGSKRIGSYERWLKKFIDKHS